MSPSIAGCAFGLPALLVEAFAERPCSGNGAAVVLLGEPLADQALQAVARSLNQSETAFLLRDGERWLLRWFTPACEVKLCGHATLAATLALGHWQLLAPGAAAALHSRSGPLSVELDATQPALARIVLPSSPLEPLSPSQPLLDWLRHQGLAEPLGCWQAPSLDYRVVLLTPQAPLAGLTAAVDTLPAEARPGLVLMQALPPAQAPTVVGRASHYQLRFFAPGLGIPEDPVTGSAHALVAPWWLQQLGRRDVVGWQCSPRPGGMVCEPASSGMIRLCGTGHLLWDGTLRLEPCAGPGRPSAPSVPPSTADHQQDWPGLAEDVWRSLLD
ncbi:PhzF family phenazine biosynthesis protein [Cyanobium sp. CH-040]|uniref:PhzF family phenazine biosynthesis protein n=1 Tax=Cyanobium sp. CH-040 TaxID=2823708 RepID=UPI0020CF5E72|nr:PhzF family phenazine biosynthesis protein [Cyanobium sp. CH-040]MCP9926975.1 PhzF family phenazine biosynthesis protein [Cyanobium sp. CH-040]